MRPFKDVLFWEHKATWGLGEVSLVDIPAPVFGF
jgi:hypothetical protein